jgi:pSer/pThr/pTyr-binding forkhead associated (FHA) protein
MMSLEWVLLGFRILAAIILYVFLGLAFYIIWRDLTHTATRTHTQLYPTYHLRVLEPDGDNTLVTDQALYLQPVTLLGRDPENVIVLKHASVSDRHACLRWDNGQWWLEDLSSQTGTTLNEATLSQPVPLTEGDVVGIGRLRFKFEASLTGP